MAKKRRRTLNFELFHGPGLKLWKKWRCFICGAYMTEPAFIRTVSQWRESPNCKDCNKTATT